MSLSRRALLKRSALGALALGTVGCTSVPGLTRPKLRVWTDASFAASADDYRTEAIEGWASSRGVDLDLALDRPAEGESKLLAAVASKQPPEVAQLDGARYLRLQPTGALRDLSALYAEVGRAWGGFLAPAERLATANGRQLVLPYALDAALLLYRADVLPPDRLPRAWRELFDVARQLQKPPGLYGIGLALNPAAADSERTLATMAVAYGASPIMSDGTRQLLADLKRAWDLGVFPPDATRWDDAGDEAAFRDGKVLAVHSSARPLLWMRGRTPDLLPSAGVAGAPAGPAGPSLAITRMRDGFGVLGPDELAGELLRHLYSPDVYRRWIDLAYAVPAVDVVEHSDPRRRAFADAARNGVPESHPGEPTLAQAELSARRPLVRMMIRVALDRWSADQAIEEAEAVAREVQARQAR